MSISVYNSPAGGARTGGDWCEVLAISEHLVALTIGDVSGHGGAASEAMAAVRASVLREISDRHIPSKVLSAANAVASAWGDGVLVTAIVAIIDDRLRTLTFANAGHPPPLLLTGDRHAFLQQSPADFPLGIFPCHSAANHVIALPPDALLALYTDGVTEHDRDPIRGEEEFVEAARLAYVRSELDVAHAIACHLLEKGRGGDDAAAIALRTAPRRPRYSSSARPSILRG